MTDLLNFFIILFFIILFLCALGLVVTWCSALIIAIIRANRDMRKINLHDYFL